MKLVIDIPEETYQEVNWRGLFLCPRDSDALVNSIKNGKPYEERPHGEWEALGFQQGYAFCRCSNCHKTMRLYRDSKNEFCCIADIRKKVVSCMYCGSDNRKRGEAE